MSDVRTKALRVVRRTGVVMRGVRRRLTGLDEHEAERVVVALAAAGLLRDTPAPMERGTALTVDEAEATLLRRLTEHGRVIELAVVGTVRLLWREGRFAVESDTDDGRVRWSLAEAVREFNAAVAARVGS